MGASLGGLSLAPATSPSLFDLAGVDKIMDSTICDVRDRSGVEKAIADFKPEIIFHLAVQPLVREYSVPSRQY